MSAQFEVSLDVTWVEVGGQISGHVLFLDEHGQLEKVRKVEITCRAKLHGSGNTEYVDSWSEPVLHAGPIQVPAKLPFSFRIPEQGPVSYEGRYVKIDWTVTVKLDVPWAIDPKQEAVFRVVPRSAQPIVMAEKLG